MKIHEIVEEDQDGNGIVQEDVHVHSNNILPKDFLDEDEACNMYSDELEMNDLYNSFPSFISDASNDSDNAEANEQQH